MKKHFLLCIMAVASALTVSAETQIVAHQGFWTPEGSAPNSISSFANADSIGVYGSEFDVILTGDGQLVVHHDYILNGADIRDITFDEVRKTRLRNGELIPSLDEFLQAAVAHPNTRLVLELKPLKSLNAEDKAVEDIVAALKRYSLVDRTDVISFSINVCIQFRKLLPDLPVYYLEGEMAPARLKHLGLTGMDYHYSHIFAHPQWVKEAKDMGLKINIWTVDDPVIMQKVIDLEPDYITTNKPVELQRLLDKTRARRIVDRIQNPADKSVTVILHRGDWRHYPENSIEGIIGSIAMGGDMVEIDLAMTSDSVMVLCHDRTLDRTTTGHGRISDLPYDSIRNVRLRNDDGSVTDIHMPTVREAFLVAKDRITMNIDKGGLEYFDELQSLADELGVTYQILNKGKWNAAKVDSMLAATPDNEMMYMPIIDILKPQGKQLWKQYAPSRNYPIAYEVCWDKMTPEVRKCFKNIVKTKSRLWVNTLWDSLNGGLTDDRAYNGNSDDIYGKLLDMGVTMIQTDRPEFLLEWLRAKGLHDSK